MAVPPSAQSSAKFESLESRRLLATVPVASYGAIPNDGADDRAAIQRAIDASKSGDTVQFAAGTYNINNGTINIKTGRTLHGASGLTSTLQFANPRERYGLGIDANSSNVTISGLKIVGAGIQATGGTSTNLKIIDNEIGSVQNSTAIYLSASESTVIDHNLIHGFNGWGYDIYDANNLSISYNIFSNVRQGGHLERPGDNVKLNYNLMTGLIRMGFEVQTQNDQRTSLNGQVIGNVIYGWRDWYWDSFGLSIVARQKDWVIRDNYVRGDYTGNNISKDPGGVERMGFGIEIGGYRAGLSGTPALNNIVGGTKFATMLTASVPNHVFTNNKFYGKPVWAWIGANPGTPPSTWTEVNNLKDTNFNNMPPPPSIAGVGPRSGTTVPTPPGNQAPAAPSDLTAASAGPTSIDLAWSDRATNEDGFRIEKSTDGQNWTLVTNVDVNITTYTVPDLVTGVQYHFRVRAHNTIGSSDWSNVVIAAPESDLIPVEDNGEASLRAPTNLAGKTLSDSRIELTWQDNAQNELGFMIERSLDGSTWTQIAQISPNSTSYIVRNLPAGTTLYFRIRAYSPKGYGAFSNVVQARTGGTEEDTTPTPEPTIPTPPVQPTPPVTVPRPPVAPKPPVRA